MFYLQVFNFNKKKYFFKFQNQSTIQCKIHVSFSKFRIGLLSGLIFSRFLFLQHMFLKSFQKYPPAFFEVVEAAVEIGGFHDSELKSDYWSLKQNLFPPFYLLNVPVLFSSILYCKRLSIFNF